MLCHECREKEATIFLKVAVNNKITEMHLCQDCASKKGMPSGFGQSLPISEMFGNISGFVKEFLPKEKKTLRCWSCGLKYSEFKETGKLGCPDCYKSFEPQMTELLARIHGKAVHTGKKYSPKDFPELAHARKKRLLEDLKKELKEAVEREDFETAAKLRDSIKDLEK
ncbi:MAG: UvrB/UvrC motif-containing protein [Elusimicrobia bacterium]|nr:UvrB/UvrC motif-containing protein [Elusimicrobiota bacterium]